MDEKIKTKPNLSIIALMSFITSFVITRVFTSLFPGIILEVRGYHIHHFWYGLAMLVVSGWLGISIEDERINRVAAILFGAGGGLVGDEIGLLLTFGDYWTEITYTIVIILAALASILMLMIRYSKLNRDFADFLRSGATFYLGVFIFAVSIAFIFETENTLVILISGSSSIIALIMILTYFVQKIIRKK